MYIASGCESCLLLPSTPVIYLSMLDDMLDCSSAKMVRGRRTWRLNSHADFQILRRDGAFRMMMSLAGKPNRGAKIRIAKRETAIGTHLKAPDTYRRHAVHTLTAASGAAIAESAGYSEIRAITAYFVRRSLLVKSAGDSYLRHVRILYTDRARDIDRDD